LQHLPKKSIFRNKTYIILCSYVEVEHMYENYNKLQNMEIFYHFIPDLADYSESLSSINISNNCFYIFMIFSLTIQKIPHACIFHFSKIKDNWWPSEKVEISLTSTMVKQTRIHTDIFLRKEIQLGSIIIIIKIAYSNAMNGGQLFCSLLVLPITKMIIKRIIIFPRKITIAKPILSHFTRNFFPAN
jgi:hypothetical protein